MEKATTNLRDRLLIRLLFRLGCRISEALALKVEEIDFDQCTVTIQHLKARLKLSCTGCGQRLGRAHTFCPKCGSRVVKTQTEEQEHRRQRVLPMDGDTLSMLKDYIRRGGPVVRDGKTLIFAINRHRAWQIVKEYAERAKLPKLINPETGKIHNISPHRLRDAFAIHAIRVDWHLRRIPYKLVKCRYHSFVLYFGMLKKLDWVEPTGEEEVSTPQDYYEGFEPRRYYRLTSKGIQAPDHEWSNPHRILYPLFDLEYYREKRKGHHYTKRSPTLSRRARRAS